MTAKTFGFWLMLALGTLAWPINWIPVFLLFILLEYCGLEDLAVLTYGVVIWALLLLPMAIVLAGGRRRNSTPLRLGTENTAANWAGKDIPMDRTAN